MEVTVTGGPGFDERSAYRIVGASNAAEAQGAKFRTLDDTYGYGLWKMYRQRTVVRGNRAFDVLDVRPPHGAIVRQVWFNVTDAYAGRTAHFGRYVQPAGGVVASAPSGAAAPAASPAPSGRIHIGIRFHH